jgi:tetratricopeptide (TPR) repeat protein
MVGEAFILRVFNRLAREAQLEAVSRAKRRALARVAATIIRIAQDYTLEGYQAPLDWLNQMVQEDAIDLVVLAEIANQLPQNTLVLRDGAAVIAAIIVERGRQLLVSQDNEQIGALLALSLNNLAIRLSELGRYEEAFTTAQEAVAIRRELATAHPDGFRPDLALALINLAPCLRGLGRHEEALTTAQEAVAIRGELAVARPDAFRPALAVSLNNLAKRLSELGRSEEALTAAQKAVAILSPYFLLRPRAFARWMNTMVDHYLDLLKGLGRESDAAMLRLIFEAFNTLESGMRNEPEY